MSEFATPPEGPSAGALLRNAREAAGLHLESLAIALKVPPRKLEALEQDRFDLLPDLTFARALASSVCRALKIDPQPILERLPQSVHPRLARVSEGINTPFREPGAGRAGWLDQLTRPVALTVVALLLAAVVIIFLPSVSRDSLPDAATPSTPPVVSQPAVPVAAGQPEASPAALPVVPAAPAAVAASGPLAAASVPQRETASTSTLVAAVPVPASRASAPGKPASAGSAAVAPVAAAATPASAAVGGVVVFRTKATSWIQVNDASGNAVLRRLMQPGEMASASGALPLSVTVGSAEGTEVLVRGKPFNLEPVSRDNVARFEVK